MKSQSHPPPFLKTTWAFAIALFGAVSGTSCTNVTDSKGVAPITLGSLGTDPNFQAIRPRFNGPVHAITGDGLGNLYFAGDFTTYATELQFSLAALRPDDASILPTACNLGQLLGPGSQIYALAELSGSLYLGGWITSYGGQSAHHLVKINPQTCQADPNFLQKAVLNGAVLTLAAGPDALYVGGTFGTVGTTTRPLIAKLKSDGSLVTTFAAWNGFQYAAPETMALSSDGSALFVGGDFTPNRIVKLNSTSGAPVTNQPNWSAASFSARVRSLLVAGDSLYVGGDFISYQGGSANRIIKLSVQDASRDPEFVAGAGFNGSVRSLAYANNTLYAGGDFTTYQGSSAPRIVALNPVTASRISIAWGTGFDQKVTALIVPTPTADPALYAVGDFTSYQGTPRRRIAKINLKNPGSSGGPALGALVSGFEPRSGFDAAPQTLLLAQNQLWVGGGFSNYRSGVPVPRIAKVHAETGLLDPDFHTPLQSGAGFDATVRALIYADGFLYAGGDFLNYKSVSRKRIAKINSITGENDPVFDSSTGFNDSVSALAYDNGILYAGGAFTLHGSQSARRWARLNGQTGVLEPIALGFGNGSVHTLAILGDWLYVGGTFTQYGTSTAPTWTHYLTRIHKTTGAKSTQFAQGTQVLNGRVRTLEIEGDLLYVGGDFTKIGTGMAQYIARFDIISGAWDDDFSHSETGFDGAVYTLKVSGDWVFAGGTFTKYGSTPSPGVAKINRHNGWLNGHFSQGAIETTLDDVPYAFWSQGRELWIGGDFHRYRLTPALNTITVDSTHGNPSR